MPSTSIPKPRFTRPAPLVTTGSTILGNWICLMSWPWAMTELTESLTVPVNHLNGIMAASRNSPKSGWSRANTICITNT